jgi:hypothetical protein
MGTLKNCYIKENDFVAREITGETIIVPIKNKVGDLGSIYTLNEIGSTIWQLIDGQKNIRQIIEAVYNNYEVTRERAEEDTLEFLKCLEETGLIRQSNK